MLASLFLSVVAANIVRPRRRAPYYSFTTEGLPDFKNNKKQGKHTQTFPVLLVRLI